MPIRLGEVFLFGFFVLLVYAFFRERPRSKESLRVSPIEKDEMAVATVIETATPALQEERDSTQELEQRSTGQPTGRKANVGGIGALFECVEYRYDEIYEAHVHRIDRRGKQRSHSYVYREPFDAVARSFISVAA